MKPRSLFLLPAVFLVLTSCSHDDATETLPIEGYFKVVQMDADIAVDINDEGFASNDMMVEMGEYFSHHYVYDLEVKTSQREGSSVNQMNFYLPQMNVYFDYLSSPQGAGSFSRSVTGYGFNLERGTEAIDVEYAENVQYYATFGKVTDIVVLDADHIKATVSKDYYDFHTAQWVELTLAISYQRTTL